MVCPGGDLVDSADGAAMGVSLLAEVEGGIVSAILRDGVV